MASVTRAIFPAAGLGTRFLPATKAQPKEMLPLVDKPLIQYAVEEAAASGIEDVVIITGRGEQSIEDHFDRAFELERGEVVETPLCGRRHGCVCATVVAILSNFACQRGEG